MGSKLSRKDQAIALRLQGRSYGYIRNTLGITSKGTLSNWFKNLKLSKETAKLLKENNFLAWKKGLTNFNVKRTLSIKKENYEACLLGLNKIKIVSTDDLLLIGTALYWAEGTKTTRAKNGQRLSFANSDSEMIAVFMKFLRVCLKVDDKKIKAGIHVYSTTDIVKAKKYWSKITKLPRERFYVMTQISRASAGKRPYNTLPYGTAVVRVNSRLAYHRVEGMIKAVSAKIKRI